MAKYDSLIDRIIANSVMVEEYMHDGTMCWIWLGSLVKNNRGVPYARMTVRGKNGRPTGVRVTRVVLREFRGVVLRRDYVAAHLCNNTLCVNPMHLEHATQKRNVRQCVDQGRHRNQFTSREPGED